MNSLNLVNCKVRVLISEPWEFGTECGVGPFYGRIQDYNEAKILITFDSAIKYSNKLYFSAVGEVRHTGFAISDLPFKKSISFNLSLLPVQVKSLASISKEGNTQGFAAIGSLNSL